MHRGQEDSCFERPDHTNPVSGNDCHPHLGRSAFRHSEAPKKFSNLPKDTANKWSLQTWSDSKAHTDSHTVRPHRSLSQPSINQMYAFHYVYIRMNPHDIPNTFLVLPFFGGWGVLFRATPMAYRGSQARGPIGAVAASLYHSHSNAESEPCLRPTQQLTATQDP